MRNPDVEQFAKILMREVRDSAIKSLDNLNDPEATNAVIGKRWQEKIEHGSTRDAIATIIPDCVDEALFYLLNAIDNKIIPLSFTTKDGRLIDLAEEGESEMAGWFEGGDWKSEYSQQRFYNDYEDSKDFQF
jgi:hypothetical protein